MFHEQFIHFNSWLRSLELVFGIEDELSSVSAILYINTDEWNIEKHCMDSEPQKIQIHFNLASKSPGSLLCR